MGYQQQQIHAIWRDKVMLLIDKKEAMIKELKQIQKKIEEEQHYLVPSDSKSEDEHWFLGFNEKGRDVYLKDVS